MTTACFMSVLATTTHAQVRRICTGDIALIETNLAGNPVTPPATETLTQGILFDSLGIITDGAGVQRVIIKVLNWDTGNILNPDRNTDKQARYNYTGVTKAELDADAWRLRNAFRDSDKTTDKIAADPKKYQKYFTMALSDYKGLSKKSSYVPRWSLSAGALTVPIKLRFDNNLRLQDFNKDISISAVGGFKYQRHEGGSAWMLPYFGVGLVSISLDSLNTQGEITSASDRSGITLCTGIMYQSAKGVQLSITGGWDYLRRREQIDWTDNGNFWVGFGIGMALFSENSAGLETDKKNK